MASTLLLIVAAVIFWPAAFQGALLFGVSALEVHSSKALTKAELRNPQKQAMQAAAQRVWRIAQLAMVAMAIGGVLLYAAAPGVGSYQASLLLVLPCLFLVLARVARVLPKRVQWLLAGALAAIGVGGYLVIGGDQWWNWGQLAIFPLAGLIILRGVDPKRPRSARAWSGGSWQGPMGPP